MELKDIFRIRLKSAREMNGLSMAALAAKMDGIVSPQAVYKYEAGKMLPNSTVLNALCDVLGADPMLLLRTFRFAKKQK